MDGNALIEVIKTGLPVINSSVSAIVGAIITTLFLRKNTSTTEFEKVKAGKFSLVIDQLLESGKMSYLEYYRCKNFLSIAKKADEKYLEQKDINQQQNYDFDWFIRFYDYASNISSQEMQELWAKIFAGEVNHPTSIPLTLLHTLSMMQQKQARSFYNLSRFVLMDAKNDSAHLLVFITANKSAYERENITSSNLKELERLGLIECNFSE